MYSPLYSGGGRRLRSFFSSSSFQYLKLSSRCCMRSGRSTKAGERTGRGVFMRLYLWVRASLFSFWEWSLGLLPQSYALPQHFKKAKGVSSNVIANSGESKPAPTCGHQLCTPPPEKPPGLRELGTPSGTSLGTSYLTGSSPSRMASFSQFHLGSLRYLTN